jgi:hypothetical protein
MKCPPYLMHVRIKNRDRKINLWIPLFIILPLILILLIIMSPFILIATAILWCFGWGKPLLILMIVPAALACLCALRGLEVNVNRDGKGLLVSVK